MERFNRTLDSSLRHYLADNQRHWDQFTDALTYGYNCTVNRMIGMKPFDLVLPRTPSPLSIQQTPTLEPDVSRTQYKLRFLTWLRGLMSTARETLLTGQDRYKRDFDKRLRMPTPQYSVGGQVLIERETSLRVDEKTDKDRVNNKLAPRMEGLFPVVALEEHTVTILRTTGLKDRVSRDRIVKAPPLRTELTEPAPSEVTVPTDVDAELTPPTAKEDDTSALLPVGVTIPPEADGRDPRGPSRSPSGTTDLESRDTTRNGRGTENANSHAEVPRQSQSGSLSRSAGSSPATGLVDALRGESHTRIISQVNPKSAAVGEEPVSKEGLRFSRLPQRSASPPLDEPPPRPRDPRIARSSPIVTRSRQANRAQGDDQPSMERESTVTPEPRDTWGRAPGKNQRKCTRAEPPVQGVTRTPTRCADETPPGTDQIIRTPVERFASMCTFGPPLLPHPGQPDFPLPAVDTPSPHTTLAPSEATIRPPPADEVADTYVVKALTGHKPGPDGTPFFRVRWYGYTADDDTWEPANFIDYNTVVRFCKRKRLPVPPLELWSAPDSVGVDN